MCLRFGVFAVADVCAPASPASLPAVALEASVRFGRGVLTGCLRMGFVALFGSFNTQVSPREAEHHRGGNLNLS